MYKKNKENDIFYSQLIGALKLENRRIKEISNNRSYRWSTFAGNMAESVKTEGIGSLRRYTAVQRRVLKDTFSVHRQKYRCPDNIAVSEADIYSDDRIAVYTCISGDYDKLIEPLFRPDNIDYFAVTDQPVSAGSAWKRISPGDCAALPKKLNNTEINRFFKFHPHLLFPEYDYSIYIDGNVQVCTDLTEYRNRTGPAGFACFIHPSRYCAYDEALVCLQQSKDTREHIDRTLRHLRKEGLPEGYGLLYCGIMVRKHNDDRCKALMDKWWAEFEKYPKRDQLLLPLVLYKNDIPTLEIGSLGRAAEEDDCVRIIPHRV